MSDVHRGEPETPAGPGRTVKPAAATEPDSPEPASPAEPPSTSRSKGARQKQNTDISRVASRQGGVVSAGQLLALGLSREAIRRRVKAGGLHDLSCDVFAVGHRHLGDLGRRRAALLGAGEGAALSFWTAAAIWRLTDRDHGRIHVSTAARTTRRQMRGVTIHRPRDLEGDRATRLGLAVTSIARTLLDLTSEVDDAELRRMVEMAITKHHIDPSILVRYGHQRRHRRGGARLSRAAAAVAGRVVLRSTLEVAFRSFCETRGLPPYEANVPFERWEMDAFWRSFGVAVELDWYSWHGAQSNYRRDRKKGLAMERAGIHLIRVAGEDLEEAPAEVEATLKRVLGGRGARDPRRLGLETDGFRVDRDPTALTRG